MGPRVVVFLDASAIIYLLEGNAAVRGSVQRVLGSLRTPGDPPPVLAASVLSRLECRVRPLRENDEAVLAHYDAFFGDPGLMLIALDTGVVDRATELRARFGLRTPDALQAGSALAADENAWFVTGDGDFGAVPHLRVRRVEISK